MTDSAEPSVTLRKSHAPRWLTRYLDAGSEPVLTRVDWTLALIALVVVAWLNSGIARPVADLIPGFGKWALFGVWLLLSMLRDRDFARLLSKQSWPLLLLLTYSVIAPFFGSNHVETYHYGLGYMFIIYSLFLYYSRLRYRPIQKVFFWYLVLDTVIVGIITFIALSRNPMVSRYLATSGEERWSHIGHGQYYGVGDYEYAISLGALAVFLGYLLFNYARKRLLLAVALASDLLLLVKASFMIAIGITLLMLLVLALMRLVKAYGWRIPTVAVLTAAGTLVLVGGSLLKSLSRVPILSPSISTRVEEVGTLLDGGSLAGTDLQLRVDLYGESFNAFLHNFAFGTAANPNGDYSPGFHTTWIDLLAVFGLIALLFTVFLVNAYRLTVDRVGPDSRAIVTVVWTYVIIVGTFNPILFANVSVTWLLFLPTAAMVVSSDLWSLKGATLRSEPKRVASVVSGTGRNQREGEFGQFREPQHEGLPKVRPTVLAIHHDPDIGGGSKSFRDVVEMLRNDYDIIACCPAEPPALSSWLQSESFRYIPDAPPIPLFNHYNGGAPILSRPFLAGLFRLARYRSSWAALIREANPDLVIVNSAVMAPLGRVARLTHTKSICFVRETFPARSRSPRTRLLYRMIDTSFDGVLFLSNHDKNQAALSQATSDVVRDCVRTDESAILSRHDACERLGVEQDRFNVLFVGGAMPIKGLDVMLESLSFLQDDNIRLLIAGDMAGTQAPTEQGRPLQRRMARTPSRFARSIEALMKRSEVQAKTVQLGLQKDMAACYSAADLVVFPSTSPHQARPVLEAGLHALPVVVSDFAETADIVSDGVNGLTFPAGDARALADRIRSLCLNPSMATKLGNANHAATLSQHTFETEQASLLRFMDEVLRR